MISATMIAWGSLTALTALVHTPKQLYFARFVLGAAEAGLFPGVIVYLSHWFKREDRAKATSNFMAAIPMSFVIGSPICGLDSRPQMVRRRRLALAVRPGGNAGHPVRRGCVFPSDGLAWRSDLARSRATAMDCTRTACRKAYQRTSVHSGPSAQVSHNSAAGWANLSQLSCVLQLCFLVPDHAETSVRIFGRAGRLARRCAVPGELHRDAGQRLALR